MELLLYILILIIAILLYFLLKKENLIKIKSENNINIPKTENANNREDNKKNFHELFDSIPEEIFLINSSKNILFANKGANKRFQVKNNNNLNS